MLRRLLLNGHRFATPLVAGARRYVSARTTAERNLKQLLEDPTSGQKVKSEVPFNIVADSVRKMDWSLLSYQEVLRLNAVSRITLDQLNVALRQQSRTIYDFFDELPRSMPLSSRLVILKHQMVRNPRPPRPVITGHQTFIFSNFSVYKIDSLVSQLIAFDDQSAMAQLEHASIKKELNKFIKHFLDNSMLPTSQTTPEDEAERDVFMQMNALKSLVAFLNDLSRYIAEKENRDPRDIKERLMEFFPELAVLGSWVPGDAEGNDKIDSRTMSKAIPNLQIARVQVYRDEMSEIISLLKQVGFSDHSENLEETDQYLIRLLFALKNGVIFKKESVALRRENRVKAALSKLIDDKEVPLVIREKAEDLKTLIDLSGFMANSSCYLRRSIDEYSIALDDIIGLISTMENEQITPLMKDKSGSIIEFIALPEEVQGQVLKILGTKLEYFIHIRNNQGQLSSFTRKELNRLYHVREHKDVFEYSIVAQSTSAVNHDVTRTLANLAAFFDGTDNVTNLDIDRMNDHIALPVPLCETPETILLAPTIAEDILSDPHMRRMIVEHGIYKRVGGPSDLGALGGIATRIDLVNALRKELDVIEKMKILYPELASVSQEVLHGFGFDLWRRISGFHRHQTLQGYGAYITVGAPGAYQRFLESVLAQLDPIDTMAQQLGDLERLYPDAYQLLIKIKTISVGSFQKHMASDAMQNLLDELTEPEIVDAANTSSRRSARLGVVKAGAARAIGLVNHWTVTGLCHVILSLYGAAKSLDAFTEEELNLLPMLLKTQWIVKDVFHTMLESMAMSLPEEAWNSVLGRNPTLEEVQQWQEQFATGQDQGIIPTMAYNDMASIDVLKFMVRFLPSREQKKSTDFILSHESKLYREVSIDQFALALMTYMGPVFKEHQTELQQRQSLKALFFAALREYKKDSNEVNKVTLLLFLRGSAGNLPHGSFFMQDARYQADPGHCSFASSL